MQTLHLRYVILRAILLGRRPSRWPTPSMPVASTWNGALPLPNLPKPTSAVESLPETSCHHLDLCPKLGAGLPLALRFRKARVGANAHCDGPDGADTRLICRWQTACDLPHFPQPFGGRESTAAHRQARASETFRVASNELSISIRGQRARRCHRAQPCRRARRSWARAGWKQTAGPVAGVETLAGVSKDARRQLFSFAGG